VRSSIPSLWIISSQTPLREGIRGKTKKTTGDQEDKKRRCDQDEMIEERG